MATKEKKKKNRQLTKKASKNCTKFFVSCAFEGPKAQV
jgi:hypothetical protein